MTVQVPASALQVDPNLPLGDPRVPLSDLVVELFQLQPIRPTGRVSLDRWETAAHRDAR
jgi:hypothetical protein